MKLTGKRSGQRPPIDRDAKLQLLMLGPLANLLDAEESAAEMVAPDWRRFRLIREVHQEVMTALLGADLCPALPLLDPCPIDTWRHVERMVGTEAPRFLADLMFHPHRVEPFAAALTASFVHTVHLVTAHGTNGGPTWREVAEHADRTVKLARAVSDGSLTRVLTG